LILGFQKSIRTKGPAALSPKNSKVTLARTLLRAKSFHYVRA
jgi:hypothetical protein